MGFCTNCGQAMAGQFCANCGQGAVSRNPQPQQHHHQQQQQLAPSAPPAPYPAMSVPMAAPVASGGGGAAAAWAAPAAAPAPFVCAVPAVAAAAAAAAAAAPPPAAVDETITVRSAGAQLVTAEAKPFREYAFAIEAGGAPAHTLRGRFSRLQQSLCCSGGGGGGGGGHAAWRAASASFPSSHVFRDYTGNEANVARRAEELRAYLDLLLRCGAAGSEGALLADGGFRAMALQLPPGAPLNAALAAIGAARRQRADHARAAEAARRAAAEAQEAARLAAIAAEQAGDCAFAQTFNQATAYAALPMGAVTTVAFPRPQRFELRNKMWGFGDALIRGPGGHPWFRMARTNPSLFGEAFRNCHFAITTMAGEPLLSLQEQFSWMVSYAAAPRTCNHPALR